MTVMKKHIIRHYTIVEVMVAMGIFLVMMTIMMQFFTSAQKVWSLASKKNMMYADARVAMNLMTRELQSMLYDNDDDGTGIYPFWYQWTNISADSKTRTGVDEYFVTDKDLPELSGGTPYLTALNFISATDLKPVDEGSDVCEIRYKFIPVYFEGSTPYTFNSVKGGTLVRSCVAEYSATGTQSLAVDYNFADCYYRGPSPGTGSVSDTGYPWDERVFNIWKDSSVTPDPTPFHTVISGVYSLRFTCYFWNSIDTNNQFLDTLEAMDSTGKNISNASITSPLAYNLAMGTPVPVAVRIDMKLMDPKDLKKLAYYIYLAKTGTSSEKAAAETQIKNLKQIMRAFSKVIYLGQR